MNQLIQGMLPLIIGYILDLIIGDPHGLWHPVQGIGWLIKKLEKSLRKRQGSSSNSEVLRGGVLVLGVLFFSCLVPGILLFLAFHIHIYLGVLVESIFCWQILATKSLKVESQKVEIALNKNGIEEGRQAVSMIVGRDTACLSEQGVIRATIETIAENTSDGVIAPMLYLVIGGPVLGFFYKAVNTMDSMIGYKNTTYLNFGKIAAKLDDVCNYIPARLAAGFMILAAALAGEDAKSAFRIFKRDRMNHASPNSAQTEAVMAGALSVQLAGDAVYGGVICKKKTIGDYQKPLEIKDIARANRLLYLTSLIAMLLFLTVKGVLLW
ncbi:MAG: adenosylcobinamide-phosphate synthase CbiB [Lachnospiraceae bacterium]